MLLMGIDGFLSESAPDVRLFTAAGPYNTIPF
jgi:hypothetical protein